MSENKTKESALKYLWANKIAILKAAIYTSAPFALIFMRLAQKKAAQIAGDIAPDATNISMIGYDSSKAAFAIIFTVSLLFVFTGIHRFNEIIVGLKTRHNKDLG